jgi:hypothetical protein
MGWQKTIVLFALAVVAVAAVAGAYVEINTFANQSFDYKIFFSPIKEPILQGQTVRTTVTVSYLRGTPEPVRLEITDNSTTVQFDLSNNTGTPEPNVPFTSNLTLRVSASAESTTVEIRILSYSDTKDYSSTYTVTVINNLIKVYGTVNTYSTDSNYPIRLQFISQQDNTTYYASLHYPSLPNAALQQLAEYTVSLPNNESYKVVGTWAHYSPPWSDKPQGTFDCGILLVNCTVSGSSINQNYALDS